MSKKIVILGALGYLGTELCKLYSGESWFNKIVAIDSRFVSERVSQLKDWNIEFKILLVPSIETCIIFSSCAELVSFLT